MNLTFYNRFQIGVLFAITSGNSWLMFQTPTVAASSDYNSWCKQLLQKFLQTVAPIVVTSVCSKQLLQQFLKGVSPSSHCFKPLLALDANELKYSRMNSIEAIGQNWQTLSLNSHEYLWMTKFYLQIEIVHSRAFQTLLKLSDPFHYFWSIEQYSWKYIFL